MNVQQQNGGVQETKTNGVDHSSNSGQARVQPRSQQFIVPKGYVLTKAESWAWYKTKLVMKTAAVTAVLITLLYIALVIGAVAATNR